MPDIEIYNIKRGDLLKLRVPAGCRKVVVKTLERNIDERTKSGIWTIGDTDWREDAHVDRWGEIMAIPKDPLPFSQKPGEDFMPWKTTVQITTGCRVWYDYLNSLNTIVYRDEYGSEYRLIDYENLYVMTVPVELVGKVDLQKSIDEKEYVIPLNGYHLFERVYKKQRGSFDVFESEKVDARKGIVRYVAKNNEAYSTIGEEDKVKLQVGDEVQFSAVPAVYLESKDHCKFDGGRMYRRSQARNVELVWRNGELILPKGRCLIKQIPEEDITPAGIILLRKHVKNHRGMVVLSSIGEIKEGDTVKYIQNGGVPMEYKGEQVRILNENHILFIEK